MAEIWASLGVDSSPTRSHRKTPLPEDTPLDHRLPHGKIGIILRCNPWDVGWSPEVRLRVLYGENRLKSENSATFRTEKLTTYWKLPGPWTTTVSLCSVSLDL